MADAPSAPTPAAAHDPARPPLLRVEGLKKHFPIKGGFLKRTVGHVKAVDDVSFTVHDGEIAQPGRRERLRQDDHRPRGAARRAAHGRQGVVPLGERSTCSTSRASPEREVRPVWREMQMIFQDPFGSLNPRKNLLEIIGEPLYVQGEKSRQKRMDRVAELLNLVGLRPSTCTASRTPSAAASGSASSSRARSPWSRAWSSPTRPSRRSTSRCKRRS